MSTICLISLLGRHTVCRDRFGEAHSRAHTVGHTHGAHTHTRTHRHVTCAHSQSPADAGAYMAHTHTVVRLHGHTHTHTHGRACAFVLGHTAVDFESVASSLAPIHTARVFTGPGRSEQVKSDCIGSIVRGVCDVHCALHNVWRYFIMCLIALVPPSIFAQPRLILGLFERCVSCRLELAIDRASVDRIRSNFSNFPAHILCILTHPQSCPSHAM